MYSYWLALHNVLSLTCMQKMCSYWLALQNVLLLEYMENCALIGMHGEMCSYWLALHNVRLLEYMGKCALIGMHGEMCSYWLALHNVLPSTCLQKCALDSAISECSFTSTAKYTLVKLQNEICIRFHFLAKVLLLTIQRTRVLLLRWTANIYSSQ